MTELIQLPIIVKLLTYALYCVSAAWLVRAGVFGIIIDSARLTVSGVIVLLLHAQQAPSSAIMMALALWLAIMLAFAVAREWFGADDILLSLGLQASAAGVVSFLFVRSLEQRAYESLASPTNMVLACVATGVPLIASIYLLSYSALRVPLAQAATVRRASGTYPRGGRKLRVIAVLAGGFCASCAALASVSLGGVSIDQTRDGIGILLFGVAYALRGRVIQCALAGASIALVDSISTAVIVSVQSPLAQAILRAAYLLCGLVIIGSSVVKWRRQRGDAAT